jgi:hypothetical protein
MPSHVWITTIGINGIKRWTGPFYGYLRFFSPSFQTGEVGGLLTLFPGILVFSRIKIHISENNENFYLGTALYEKMGEEHPY